jgi:hypothetical protein
MLNVGWGKARVFISCTVDMWWWCETGRKDAQGTATLGWRHSHLRKNLLQAAAPWAPPAPSGSNVPYLTMFSKVFHVRIGIPMQPCFGEMARWQNPLRAYLNSCIVRIRDKGHRNWARMSRWAEMAGRVSFQPSLPWFPNRNSTYGMTSTAFWWLKFIHFVQFVGEQCLHNKSSNCVLKEQAVLTPCWSPAWSPSQAGEVLVGFWVKIGQIRFFWKKKTRLFDFWNSHRKNRCPLLARTASRDWNEKSWSLLGIVLPRGTSRADFGFVRVHLDSFTHKQCPS